MPVNWTINDIEKLFFRPRDRIELIYGNEREAYRVKHTAPLSVPVQFGAIGAGASTGMQTSPGTDPFFEPDRDVMYHWIPIVDQFLRIQYRYKGIPQLGTYRAPAVSFFDYTMGTQMFTFAVAGVNPRFLMPPTLQMFSMFERYPEVDFTNLGAGPLTLVMLMFGRKYRLEKLDVADLDDGKPYSTVEFGLDVK